MAKEKGYIKINRKILDNPFWMERPFDFSHAWIDLLLLASWKDHETISKGEVIQWKRGEVKTSYLKLAERWGWSVNKVRRTIRHMERLKMVTTDSTRHGTTLTIENYTIYQDGRSTNGTTNGRPDGTTDGITDGTHQKKGTRKEKERNNYARARAGGGNPYFALLESGVYDDDEK